MRVLHVGKFYPPFAGGMETFLADLLHAQQEQGIAAAALVHHERPGWRGHWPSPGTSPAVWRAPCLGRLLYAPVSPSFPRWLHRVIRAERPDLLHLHLPNTSAFAALALPAARRLPWVIHWHSDVVASTLDRRLALAYRLYRPLEQRLLAASRAVIVTSPDYLDASPALAPWRDRCRIVPLGLNPDRLPDPTPEALAQAERLWNAPRTETPDPRSAASRPPPERRGGTRILAIGRLTYYKGHEVLLRAAARLPASRLAIVGTGERHDRLASDIRALGLAGRVSLHGFQPEPILNALLASCDLLCLPSLERTEAFGMVLLEAMRFGKPVVASDIPGSGVGWVVRQAGHGLLTPPGDAQALAEALETLEMNPGLRERLGQSGARVLRERFDIAAVARDISALYTRILDRTPAPTESRTSNLT